MRLFTYGMTYTNRPLSTKTEPFLRVPGGTFGYALVNAEPYTRVHPIYTAV